MGFLNNLFSSFGNFLPQLGSMFGMGGGNKSAGPTQATTPGTASGGGLFSGNPMGAFGAGLGITGLGQMMNKKISAPNFNTPQMGAYQNFTTNPPQLPQSMQDELNKSIGIQQEQESRNLRDVYKNARPGTDYTTDSNYQRDLANLQRGQASERTNAMMGPTLAYLQPQQQSLADQAQMSLYGPSLQYGQDVARRQQQNQMFGNLGSMFFLNSLFPGLGGR